MRRIREIDIMRTAAIILMVVYHITYDLNNFGGLPIAYDKPPLNIAGKLSAYIFIFLSGISSCFSIRSVKRGAGVFACGLLITLVTFIAFRERFIVFGMLHLLGGCIMLSPLMKKLPTCMLGFFAAASAVIGLLFNNITLDTRLLLPLGIAYEGFSSLDYYPLFPYISVFMAGIIYYRFFYRDRKSIFNLKANNDIIEKLSRKSLLIYLIHQPVILGVIYAVTFIIK